MKVFILQKNYHLPMTSFNSIFDATCAYPSYSGSSFSDVQITIMNTLLCDAPHLMILHYVIHPMVSSCVMHTTCRFL